MRMCPWQWNNLMALVGMLAVLAAACADGDGDDEAATAQVEPEPGAEVDEADDAPEDSSEGGDAAGLSASHRGVTEDTITVGISLLDMDALADSGLVEAGWGDQEAMWRALVDDLNARGGINGRMVDATVEFYSPIDTSDAERVCVVFDEDLEAFAALGGFLGPAAGAMPCLANNEEFVVIGGDMSQSVLEESSAAWFTDGRSVARRLQEFVQLLGDNGDLDDKTVAVVSGDEVASDTDDVLIPALEEAGVEIVATAVNEVVGTDIPAEDALWEVIAEQIRVAGADAVMINGDSAAAVRGIASAGLDVEMWVTDPGQLNALGDTLSEEADGAITIQGLTQQETWEDEAMGECREVIKAAHPDMAITAPDETPDSDEAEYQAAAQACRTMELFEIVTTAAGADLTPETVAAAAAAELDPFSFAGIPAASLGPDKPDALDSARLTVWDTDSGEGGALVELTPLGVPGG